MAHPRIVWLPEPLGPRCAVELGPVPNGFRRAPLNARRPPSFEETTMTTVLVTGAAGDTGRPTVKLLLERGFRVKALVRKDDLRAQRLRDLGAEVVLGDMLS